MQKKWIRNTDKKMIAGVVAGLQEAYFPHVDLTLLRALVVVATAFAPPLILAYLVLWVLLPTPEQATKYAK